jgi:hypothetical protein
MRAFILGIKKAEEISSAFFMPINRLAIIFNF